MSIAPLWQTKIIIIIAKLETIELNYWYIPLTSTQMPLEIWVQTRKTEGSLRIRKGENKGLII